MAGTGRSNPPGPHSGSRGLVWKDGWLGIYGSLRPGSKEDAELSLQLPPPTPTPSLTLRTRLFPHTPRPNTKL